MSASDPSTEHDLGAVNRVSRRPVVADDQSHIWRHTATRLTITSEE